MEENKFNYRKFIAELRANMLLHSKDEEDNIINTFESRDIWNTSQPNGYINLEQFKSIVSSRDIKTSFDILEKARLLIFGSYIFL